MPRYSQSKIECIGSEKLVILVKKTIFIAVQGSFKPFLVQCRVLSLSSFVCSLNLCLLPQSHKTSFVYTQINYEMNINHPNPGILNQKQTASDLKYWLLLAEKTLCSAVSGLVTLVLQSCNLIQESLKLWMETFFNQLS